MKKIRYIFILLIIYSCGSDSDPGPSTPNCDNGPIINQTEIQDLSTCQSSDGQINISATGSSLEYSIDGVNFQSSEMFSGLSAGEYQITVRDNLGCTATATLNISSPESTVSVSNIEALDSGCEQSNGSIIVSAAGQGELSFSINGGAAQQNNVFSGLSAGTYQLSVEDENGCSTAQSVKVLSGTSFSIQVRSIFVASCNISNCHNGSNSGLPNFNDFDEIKSRAADIKARTQSGNMPVNSSLTQEQKDLIACWVDDGAFDN